MVWHELYFLFAPMVQDSQKDSIRIADIPITLLSKKEVMNRVRELVDSGIRYKRISTVGPEFIVRAKRDRRFMDALCRADICVSDGCGTVLASVLYGSRVERCTGAELLTVILEEAEKRDVAVFIAVRCDGLSAVSEILASIRHMYPSLRVTGQAYDMASFCDAPQRFPQQHLKCGVVLCNFGAPWQEYFLESLRESSKSVKLGIGVGGAFDFLTGKRMRAPALLRCIGLEWLWRLLLQPSRWKRIFQAIGVFPVIILLDAVKKYWEGRRRGNGA